MDPLSGRLFTETEMARMSEAEKERLVRIDGKAEDIQRISQAVRELNRKDRRRINRQNGLKSNGDPK